MFVLNFDHQSCSFQREKGFIVLQNGVQSSKRVNGRRADGVNLQDRLRLHQGGALKVVRS